MIRFGTPVARWVLAATVLGSGIAFLDSTVVNVALPAIARDLNTDVAGLQWTVDAYLVTLTSLLLLGGALGDHYGRKRIFLWGLVGFTFASMICAAAPNTTLLAVARALQGATGAFLVPGSLAILAASFVPGERGRAVGAWSGLAGISSAIGPFLGGWLIDAASWRYVFLINLPLAAVTFVIAVRHVPESHAANPAPLDLMGAVLVSLALAAGCWALIQGGEDGLTALVGGVGLLSVILFAAFLMLEARLEHPMLPLRLFRSRQFSGANAVTLAVYAALGGATFFIVLELQLALGYSALEAGAALIPVTVLMLTLSSRMGALSQRIGPRLPMTVGPALVAVGMLMYTRIEPGASYWTSVFPAAIVFGLGLATTVAPLTATVLAAVDDDDFGVASGINNSVARLAGLLSVAVLPAVVGLDTTLPPAEFTAAAGDALRISAAIAALGSVVAFLTIKTQRKVAATTQPSLVHACGDGSLAEAS